ncbi:MAG: hypothetical protein M3N54_16480 [Acidobacteriota bacterium]|nr:hypothetical protein [Acidobacteriota bacterium]
MRIVRFSAVFIIFLSAGYADITGSSSAPAYTADSIVHAATQVAEALAPNTIATVYGTNLSFTTRAAAVSDLSGGSLPLSLDGVAVEVGNFAASLLYISPGQINFLVPYNLTAGQVSVWISRQGLTGPVVKIQLNSAAPGLFPWNGNLAIASHLDGSLISADAPATGGEIVVIYAAGLGRVSPDTTSGKIAPSAAVITALAQFQILLAGTPCARANVLYAGIAPGFAGLYQINLKLPDKLAPNPEIRVSIGTEISPAKIMLAVH